MKYLPFPTYFEHGQSNKTILNSIELLFGLELQFFENFAQFLTKAKALNLAFDHTWKVELLFPHISGIANRMKQFPTTELGFGNVIPAEVPTVTVAGNAVFRRSNVNI